MSKPAVLMLGGGSERMRERLSDVFDLTVADGDPAEVIAERGDTFQYCLSMYHGGVGAAQMDAMPNLKAISNYGVGYDSIDTPAAVERGIVVTHTPDVLNDEVANTAIMMLLASARNLVHDQAYLRHGRWEAEGNAPLSRSIAGRLVGIVGMGRIGQTIAEKLAVFGTEIAYHSRTAKDVPLRYVPDLVTLSRQADFLIVITPGGPATRHLINAEVMDALGPDGTLVNVARGSVVDQEALIAALQEGRLGFAALDVFEAEPHVPEALIALKNTLLLPHVGSATVETRQAMGDLAVDNLIEHHKTGRAVRPVPECQHL
ncbi:MAG: 2-hydroxyacid dehydrogenase [Pseudomonadota bacterium]